MADIDAGICAYICPFSFLLSFDGWKRYAFVLMPVRQMCQKKANKFNNASSVNKIRRKKKENYSTSLLAKK